MDAFFASVEIRENPSLRGKPVVVGADPEEGRGRGVVSTCSYEARKYGIRSAMPISKAYKLCPHAVFLPVNMKLYKEVSQKVMTIIKKYGDKFEQVSIDEAFLDVTQRAGSFDKAVDIAKELKAEIKRKEDLTCSVGIGPNKFIAKLASDVQKPDGLTVVKPEDVQHFLDPLPVRKIIGVGEKTEKILNSMGIYTIKDLRETPLKKLLDTFGKWGYSLYLLSRGIGSEEVEERKEPKSFSREITFRYDQSDFEILIKTLEELTKEVYSVLKENGYFCKNVGVKIRLEDFVTHTRQRTLPFYTDSYNVIWQEIKSLFTDFYKNLKKKVRLLGVRLSHLEKKPKIPSLFPE